MAQYLRAARPVPATADSEQELVAMKKRSRERHVEQTQAPQQDQTAPTKPTVEPALCGICQAPMPCATHDKPAVTLSDETPATKALIEDAPDNGDQPPRHERDYDLAQPGTIEELHQRIIAKRREHEEKANAYQPPKPTERQQAQIDAEMAAGRRATERAAAQQAARPPRQTDPREGTTTPVFRPGDVDEYRGSFKSQVQTRSKDAK